jgi:8-oxo-dGTP pyrophosphatase MutT (NUDIX family)
MEFSDSSSNKTISKTDVNIKTNVKTNEDNNAKTVADSNAPPGFILPVYNPVIKNNYVQAMLINHQYTSNGKPQIARPKCVVPPDVLMHNIHDDPACGQKIYMRKKNVACANCGGIGHIYKHCNQPIISYGVICFQLNIDIETNTKTPKYLMVQRKDSLSYVEFIRGKYNIKSKTYIMNMFTMMTNNEREGIANRTFEMLWQDMWCKNITDESKTFSKEFKDANDKFQLLKKGYYIKSGDQIQFFDISYIIENTSSKYNETEWGFPKGRRNINEGDVNCALREFREETGIPQKCVHLCNNYIKPLEEVFSGSNNVRYKHVYYIAKININSQFAQCVLIDPKNKQQCKEIRNVGWFEYEEAQSKIREQNIERKELLRRLHTLIMKHVYY